MKKNIRSLAILMLSAVLFTGCGASKSVSYERAESPYVSTSSTSSASGAGIYKSEAAAADSYSANEVYTEEADVSAASDSGSSTVSQNEIESSSRKLITRMNMRVQTEYFDDLQTTVENRVNELGGYIESSDLWNGSSYNYYSSSGRSLSLVIRIPSNRLDNFVQTMSDNSNILSSSKSVEDITLTYVDLESHKNALKTEEKRLLELMEKAENMEDIISIESRLTDVRYQLQSMESQLRTYDNMVDYSTINLDIEEVERITPPAQKSTKDRIVTGITESFYDVSVGLKEFGIAFIIDLPYIIVFIIVVILLVLFIRLLVRLLGGKERRMRRAQKKEEKRQRKIHAKEEAVMRYSSSQNQATTMQKNEPAQTKAQAAAPDNTPSGDDTPSN